MGPERGRSTIDGGYELEAGSRGLYCLDTACMSPTGPRGSQGHRAGQGAERSQGSMHREVSMHESRPEQQQRTKLFGTHRGSDCRICMYTHLLLLYLVSPFLYCFTMSWWVNSWISVELQLCCCSNKSRVRASHTPWFRL